MPVSIEFAFLMLFLGTADFLCVVGRCGIGWEVDNHTSQVVRCTLGLEPRRKMRGMGYHKLVVEVYDKRRHSRITNM